MHRNFLHWLVISLCFAVWCQPGRADEIDRYLTQEQKIYRLPAVVIGIVRNGKLVDSRALGISNVELNVRASVRHVFEIGSISKQFTAYAILILRDRGQLELDAPVGRYIPGLPDDWAKVTLHRLLTHTSGLPDLEEAFGYGVYRETPDDAAFLLRLTALKVGFQPGENWQYANTNYWLLARVIESLSGLSYAEFMRKNIFGPLGMASTRSALPDQVLPGRASGYRHVGDALENRDAIRPNTGRGLGDIATTLADMARWESEQLTPALLAPSTAALARQPVTLNNGKTAPYGYGWSTEKILPMPTLQHGGQTAGFTASYIRVPERRLAAIVFSNVYAAPVDIIGKFALQQVEPAMRMPRPRAIPDNDPQTTEHVLQLMSLAVSADKDWREAWFAPDYWRDMKPWLGEIAENYRRYGKVRAITLVAREADADTTTLTYRVLYASLSRLATLRFDAQGRIARREIIDE